MASISLDTFDKKLQKALFLPELRPYIPKDGLQNGLQTRGKEQVTRVGFGVSASLELFRLAKKQHCDAVIVHHGIDIDKTKLHQLTYERLAWLIQNKISLWSAHFTLDAHPVLGNNAQILKTAGVQRTEPYSMLGDEGAPWGRVGFWPNGVRREALLHQLLPRFSPRTTAYHFGPSIVKKAVCVSGKGAPYGQDMDWLIENHVDLYITGEVHEWNREFFREAQINFIAGGHYHTEMFGVQALQQWVEKHLHVKTAWLDLQNDI